MTATETPDGVATASPGDAHTADGAPAEGRAASRWLDDRLVGRVALALTLAPLVVSALVLLFAVGGEYNPSSDHALTELQTRSVGRDEVLVGLFSREDWNHPGPAEFYVLAPIYWLTGGMSVGISIGALVINGASVAGMALLARRRGGTPLMLVTLLFSALLLRALSASFWHDPWNCFVTALPYGLLIFLTWSLWHREAWALPVAAAVTTFLAQAHVGFLALATPLFALGVLGLAVSTVLETDGAARSEAVRSAVKAGAVGAAVLVVGWLPTAIDALTNSPNNAREIADYFRHAEEPTHSVTDGWEVMSGQFGGAPEWLTVKQPLGYLGQSPHIGNPVVPWMLLLVIVAGVVLWRRRVAGSRTLLAVLAATFVVGVVAVVRTIGLAFDYRLRWTFIPAMIGAVVIGWAVWRLVADRWPRTGPRALTVTVLAGLTVLAGVNTFTAAVAGTPQGNDSEAVAVLTEQVVDHLGDDFDGTVLVDDAHHSGAWQARGLVLQLERRGIDVGVERSRVDEYGRHRVIDRADADVVFVVSADDHIELVADRPDHRMVAEWQSLPDEDIERLLAERDAVDAAEAAGEIDFREAIDQRLEVVGRMTEGKGVAWRAAVFVDERAGSSTPSEG